MSSEEETEALVRETQELMAMPEAERFKYVVGVVEGLSEGLKEILKEKKRITQAKLAQQFFKELNDKTTTLMPPIIYTIKAEFQEVYIRVLREIGASSEERARKAENLKEEE